ncbi:secreted RxLR effector protein 161-like [Humulus lupulus]|uniref:secreted RxLR effector protein 161-like n=1 Tax=Humulus lupulus TaxID=3486 RepID=UPI002B40C7E1|nr:secreted RxLR effector protein 161-like [Humulus lupulus]
MLRKCLTKFSYLKIKEANALFDSSLKLEKNNGRRVTQFEYASALKSLVYTAHCTRADTAYVVSKHIRFTSNPSIEHWKTTERVLGYHKRTKKLDLQCSKFPKIFEGYSDASLISSARDNLSTVGWVFMLKGGAVSWGPKKRTYITLNHGGMSL